MEISEAMMLLTESGRSEALRRLQAFRHEVKGGILAEILQEPWFRRCAEAIADVPHLVLLEAYCPTTLPLAAYCDMPKVFVERLEERVRRLSKAKGFSAAKYRKKFLSDGADCLATLFEINFLGRYQSLLELEPTISSTGARPDALIGHGEERVYVECFALYYPEMLADLTTRSGTLARRLADKILGKAEQLEGASHPGVVAFSLSHQHLIRLNDSEGPLQEAGRLAFGQPKSRSISASMVCVDYRADQVVGPFTNPEGPLLSKAATILLRRPWVADPSWPLNHWSPLTE
jgi:hypothetical protein